MAKDPYKYFRVEARELVEGLAQGILEIEKGGASAEVVSRLLRLAHTLKGAARVVKQAAIADLAHSIEDLLAPLRDSPDPKALPIGDDALRLVDQIASRVRELDGDPREAAP